MRCFSRFFFFLFCASCGLVIAGCRATELLILIPLFLGLQTWTETRFPAVVILRSSHVGNDHDHEVISNVAAPLSATHRCLWLHHEGHGEGRLLDDILSGLNDWRHILFSVLILLVWFRMDTGSWSGAAPLPDKVLAVAVTTLCARAVSKLLKDCWDTGYFVFLIVFSLAGIWTAPALSWHYAGALAVSYAAVALAAWLLEGWESRWQPGFWHLDTIRADDNLKGLRAICGRHRSLRSAVSTFPRRLYDLSVEHASLNDRWQQVIAAALAERPLMVMDVSGYERSSGLQWELETARLSRAPTLLIMSIRHPVSIGYVCLHHQLAAEPWVLQVLPRDRPETGRSPDAVPEDTAEPSVEKASVGGRDWPVIILPFNPDSESSQVSEWIKEVQEASRILENCAARSR